MEAVKKILFVPKSIYGIHPLRKTMNGSREIFMGEFVKNADCG